MSIFRRSLVLPVILLLTACGGGGDAAVVAVTPTPIPTNTDCVLGTSKIDDCTI